jgi:TRAP-type C4-dicarboxylate transport system substrate-binding protein
MRLLRTMTLLVLGMVALGYGPAAAQPVTIKLATLVPDGSVWDKILKTMGAEWSQATKGRVQLRMYPGGVAGDEPDVVRKMRIGQIQAAALTTAGLSAIDPSFKMFSIPMFFDSYDELHAVLAKMEPTFKQRLEAKGFVLLNWGHGGWVYFFTRQPVETVDQLKHNKMFVWAGDETMTSLWKSNGYHPVALAATDILTGLQTGMIDAYPTTPLLALTLQWYRSTPNMVGIGLAPLVGGLVVTKQAWQKIAPADQAEVLEACHAAELKLMTEVPKQDTTAIGEMVRRGLNVTRVSPAAAAEWRTAAEAFARSMRSTAGIPEILDMGERERNAFRKKAPAGTPGGSPRGSH